MQRSWIEASCRSDPQRLSWPPPRYSAVVSTRVSTTTQTCRWRASSRCRAWGCGASRRPTRPGREAWRRAPFSSRWTSLRRCAPPPCTGRLAMSSAAEISSKSWASSLTSPIQVRRHQPFGRVSNPFGTISSPLHRFDCVGSWQHTWL